MGSKDFGAIQKAFRGKDEIERTKLTLGDITGGASSKYEYLALNSIELNPNNDYNEADSEEGIIELAEDIKRNGLLHNIVVSYTEDGRYKLLSGERRLRAYKHIYAETGDDKYSNIYSLVRSGLSEIEEMIILDAANLQVRNGAGDEKRTRKATIRFIDNLKKKFNISEESAIIIAKEYAGVSDRTVERNVVLERDLHASLLKLLDDGVISKSQAMDYAALPISVQESIALSLLDAITKGAEEAKRKANDITIPTREIAELQHTLDELKQSNKETDDYIKELKKLKALADASQATQIQTQIDILSAQKAKAKKEIKNVEKELNARIRIVTKIEDSNEEILDKKRLEVTTQLDHAIIGMRRSVDRTLALNLKDKAQYLEDGEKAKARTKLREMIRKIEDIMEEIR